MNLIVIVPCGKYKIWDKEPDHRECKARDAYVSSYFKVNREFAEKFAAKPPDRWLILSAKYGFIKPESLIRENYCVSFKKRSTNPISVDRLKPQARGKGLLTSGAVISLGGHVYVEKVREALENYTRIFAVTEGKMIGKAMSLVKDLTKLNKGEMLRRIARHEDPK